jgi:hypothetical protein
MYKSSQVVSVVILEDMVCLVSTRDNLTTTRGSRACNEGYCTVEGSEISHPCAFVPRWILTVAAPRPPRLCAAQAMRTAWVRAEKDEGGAEGRSRDGLMSSGLL